MKLQMNTLNFCANVINESTASIKSHKATMPNKTCRIDGTRICEQNTPFDIDFSDMLRTRDRGDFWALLAEILVFASPTGYCAHPPVFLY